MPTNQQVHQTLTDLALLTQACEFTEEEFTEAGLSEDLLKRLQESRDRLALKHYYCNPTEGEGEC